jgi:hypothetical protein
MTQAKFQLMQGDCLELMKGIPAGSVDAVITDPPYGVGLSAKRAKQLRQLTGQQAVTPAKVPTVARTRPVQPRKPPKPSLTPPTVGMRYRVARGLGDYFVTPPPVGTVCTIWHVSFPEFGVCLEGVRPDTDARVSFSVSLVTLRERFEEVS